MQLRPQILTSILALLTGDIVTIPIHIIALHGIGVLHDHGGTIAHGHIILGMGHRGVGTIIQVITTVTTQDTILITIRDIIHHIVLHTAHPDHLALVATIAQADIMAQAQIIIAPLTDQMITDPEVILLNQTIVPDAAPIEAIQVAVTDPATEQTTKTIIRIDHHQTAQIKVIIHIAHHQIAQIAQKALQAIVVVDLEAVAVVVSMEAVALAVAVAAEEVADKRIRAHIESNFKHKTSNNLTI